MRHAARPILIALDFLVLSSPPFLQRWVGGDTRAYAIATVLLAVLNLLLIRLWSMPSHHNGHEGHKGKPSLALILCVLCALCVSSAVILGTCRIWLHEILVWPHDPLRADMLVLVQQGIRRVLQGQNPYTVYPPWGSPLAYGPLLWGPFVVPFVLHADVRFLTVAGMLFVPIVCAAAAIISARWQEWWVTGGWLVLLVAIGLNPDLRGFVSIGHTPVYWPLIALFAWLVAGERWTGAAVVAGLLIVARTTMVAVAPVFLMAVWWRARQQFPRAVAWLAGTATLPFAPFAIWNWRSLQYALYGSYQVIEKGFVWTATTWVQHTIGVTGWLLRAGWQRASDAVQIAVLALVYVFAWRAIRRGSSVLPWMGLALLAFSMTTVWPVFYIYFDVFLLFVCGAFADAEWLRPRRPVLAWAATFAASIVIVAAVAWFMIPAGASIDAGTAAGRPFLYKGFGGDHRDGDRTFVVVDGERAEIVVPRRGRRNAMVDIDCAALDVPQQLTAVLNGTPIGTVTLSPGWHRVSLAAPGGIWQIGLNEIELHVTDPLGGPATRARLALDRVSVRTR